MLDVKDVQWGGRLRVHLRRIAGAPGSDVPGAMHGRLLGR
jgi:hypothetical protein